LVARVAAAKAATAAGGGAGNPPLSHTAVGARRRGRRGGRGPSAHAGYVSLFDSLDTAAEGALPLGTLLDGLRPVAPAGQAGWTPPAGRPPPTPAGVWAALALERAVSGGGRLLPRAAFEALFRPLHPLDVLPADSTGVAADPVGWTWWRRRTLCNPAGGVPLTAALPPPAAQWPGGEACGMYWAEEAAAARACALLLAAAECGDVCAAYAKAAAGEHAAPAAAWGACPGEGAVGLWALQLTPRHPLHLLTLDGAAAACRALDSNAPSPQSCGRTCARLGEAGDGLA